MTPEQHREYAVEFMRQAITDASPSLADAMKPNWAERRIRTLEATIKRFCEFNVDTNETLGMSSAWKEEFLYLCDSIDFDPEAHNAEGYDREDV